MEERMIATVPKLKTIKPGRIITKAPTKPIIVAIHRCFPIFSGRKTAARQIVKSGTVNCIADKSASGNRVTAINHPIFPT